LDAYQSIFCGVVPDMFFLKHALFVLVVALISCLSTQRFATAIVPQDEGMMKFLFPFPSFDN
jgi:uncharacterized membrane protein